MMKYLRAAMIAALYASCFAAVAPLYDLTADKDAVREKVSVRADEKLGSVLVFPAGSVIRSKQMIALPGAITVEAVVRAERPAAKGSCQIIASPGSLMLELYTYPDNNAKIVLTLWSGGKMQQIKTAESMTYDAWHHIAVTADTGSRTGGVFIDGKPLGEYQLRQIPESIDAPTRPFGIGERFIGDMASLTITAGVRSAADIAAAGARFASTPSGAPAVRSLLTDTERAARMRVFLMGDSTVANYTSAQAPLCGWGQVFGRLFASDIAVVNRAMSGRSTKSFIDEQRWAAVINDIGEGDHLFIQFGHNDEKKDKPEVYAASDGAYRDNLRMFIEKAREKKAVPILVTPVGRRTFGKDGKMADSHGAYPAAMKAVAAETSTPIIDLTAKSMTLYDSLGAEGAKKLFCYTDPGQYPNFPNGSKDDTHFCETGALEIALLVAEGIRESGIALAASLK